MWPFRRKPKVGEFWKGEWKGDPWSGPITEYVEILDIRENWAKFKRIDSPYVETDSFYWFLRTYSYHDGPHKK